MENLQSSDLEIKLNWTPILAIFFISFGLYANTLNFDFVLDDKIVITNNEFTKKGTEGIKEIFSHDSMTGFWGKDKSLVAGGRYRPLSMATHAMEWELVEEKPFLYHFNNVILYALSGALLYLVLLYLFPLGAVWYLSIPFIAAILFQANPLHTEVVANIKSRDEILSVFFAFASFLFILKFLKSRKLYYLPIAGLLFFLGLLSKESAIVFIGIIPLFIYILKKELDIKDLILPTSVLLLPGVLYVLIRFSIVGGLQNEIASELMNNPFLGADSSDKWATILYVLFIYVKLLFVPHPLTHDYYPKQIEITGWADPLVIFSILIHIGLLLLFVNGLRKRSFHGLLAGIYLGGIILYSNLLFPIGTFLNERFLYVPTLGLALLIAYLIVTFIKSKQAQTALVLILFSLYSFKTYNRNFAWENDSTLAITDIENSGNSAKCNMSAGAALIELSDSKRKNVEKKKDLGQAIKYLKKSLEIYPTYGPPILLLGNANTKLKKYDQAVLYYQSCLNTNNQAVFALQNLEFLAQEAITDKQFVSAESAYILYLKHKTNPKIEEKLGELYGKDMGELEKSIIFLNKAYNSLPNDASIVQKLGVAFAISGNNERAAELFKRGTVLDSANANLWLNLGYIHAGLGNQEESKRSLDKAYELDPKLKNE